MRDRRASPVIVAVVAVAAVRAAAARRPLRRVPARRRLSRRPIAALSRAAGAAGRDRRAGRPAGTAGIRSSSSTAFACAPARSPDVDAAARAAAGRPGRRLDVAAAARAAPEAARDRAAAARDPPRPRRHAARRGHRDRSRARRPTTRRSPTGCCASRRSSSTTRSSRGTTTCATRRSSCSTTCNVRLESRFGRHRFGLIGTPPAELAAPIDLRGEVRGGVGRRLAATRRGQLYVRLDYADVAAWREWLPLPAPIASGKGALRLWFDFAQRRADARSSPTSSSPT